MTISGTPSRAISTACRVTELIRREPTAHARPDGGLAQLGAGSARRPRTSAGRAGRDAQQRADRELEARGEPGLQLLPGPVVHADLAAAAALAAAHEQRAAPRVEVGFAERERFVDAEPGAPEHDDERPQPRPVDIAAGVSHDGDDLADRGRVGGVALS